MSSAHEEAGHGRVPSISDDEDEAEEKDSFAARAKHTVHASEPPSASGLDGDQDSVAEDKMAIDGGPSSTGWLGNGGTKVTEPNGMDVVTTGVDKPSSADGSLSIPDDTPSIQVRVTDGETPNDH